MQKNNQDSNNMPKQVENALLKRALGFTYEETKTLIEKTSTGEKKKVERVQKYCPPDIEAIKMLLKKTLEYEHKFVIVITPK